MSDRVSSNAVIPGTPSVPVAANSSVPDFYEPSVPNTYESSIPEAYEPSIPSSYESEPFEESGNESRPINLISTSNESGSENVSVPVQPSSPPVTSYQRRFTEGTRNSYVPRDLNAPGPSAPVQESHMFGPSFLLEDPYAAGPSRAPVYNPNLVMPVATAADRSEYALRQMSRMNNSLIRTREAIENQAQALNGAYLHASEAMAVAKKGKETTRTLVWVVLVLVALVALVVALLIVVLIKM